LSIRLRRVLFLCLILLQIIQVYDQMIKNKMA
jgi:hypothetical protein